MSRTRAIMALTAAASIFTACAALVGTSAAQAADPLKIRLSYVVPIANWTFMLMEKKDLAKNLGKAQFFARIALREVIGVRHGDDGAGAIELPAMIGTSDPIRVSIRPGQDSRAAVRAGIVERLEAILRCPHDEERHSGDIVD